jgi:O-antigen/teichoic acid export membrane protein
MTITHEVMDARKKHKSKHKFDAVKVIFGFLFVLGILSILAWYGLSTLSSVISDLSLKLRIWIVTVTAISVICFFVYFFTKTDEHDK